jgi:formylglycine-generating enzyme required for sulfatase activity
MRAIAMLMRLCSLALCVAAIAALALGTARAQSIDFGRYHALVIGNNDYEHWTTLTTAVRDAQEVAKTLEQKYGFKVRLLENATASRIVRALNQLRSELTEVDNLLIYYAGHGHLDGDTGFWIGTDGDKNFEDSWVPVSTITRNLDRMSARHVLVVADSCFSGTLTRSDDDAGLRTGRERSAWLARMTTKRARLALTSGGLEPVSDVGGGDHSVFAKEFLDALRENDGVLEGQALFGRIKQDVVVNANQTPDYGKIRLASDDGGDFLLVPRDLQVAAVAEQQNFGPQRGAGGDPREDFKVWSVIQHSANPIDLETFIEAFPDSIWVPFARNRLAKLAAEPPQELALAPGEVGREIVPSPLQPAVGVYAEELAPGTEFRDCLHCPEMVVVPAGEFMMGSPPDEPGRDADEGPQHEVTIPRPFAVGKYEVTRSEFAAFVDASGHGPSGGCFVYTNGEWQEDSGKNWRDPGYEQSDQHPVTCVSWEDAQAYVRWLGGEAGKDYRLLSEAEWEYAARAESKMARFWGNDANLACNFANVHDDTSKRVNGFPWENHTCDDGFAHTASVGSFDANDLGLHDMLGNVWEWSEDCWHSNYDDAPRDGSAWTTGGDCRRRVLRGGSWVNSPGFVRSADRSGYYPDDRYFDNGFRVARTID